MNTSDSSPATISTLTSDATSDLDAKLALKPAPDINPDRYAKPAMKNAKRMAKRVYVKDSQIHGKGLFAAKDLKEDVSLGRLHGMLTEEDGTYVLWLNKHIGLEITNEFRFINHDSNPNCALTDTEVVTLRAIEKDEELTHDYGWED